MKKAVILAGVLFVLVCIEPAFGQSGQTVAIVQVPFEFVVGTTELPAGAYAVRLDSQTEMLSLVNRDNGLSAISPVHNILLVDYAESSKLIFAFDGHRRVLHRVVVSGDRHIHDLTHGPQVAELPTTPSS